MLDEKIKRALNEYNIDSNAALTVAFSGGGDSAALLAYLRMNRKYNVSAVHINHGIRGSEADRDEEFCRIFCKNLGVPLTVYRVDVPSLAKERGQGIEEAARQERYRIFDEITDSGKADYIATAHHANDNLETVIFNMLRGTALAGLRGIPHRRGAFIRPLIYCTRREIEDYCNERGIESVYDSTNSDCTATRNFIRHKIVPLTEEVNPRAAEHISEMCRRLADDEDYLESAARNHLGDSRSELVSLHPALSGRVLRILSEEAGAHPQSAYIDEMSSLLFGNCYGEVSLPGGVTAIFDRDEILFTRKETRNAKPNAIPLTEGEAVISDSFGVAFSRDVKYINGLINIYRNSINITADFGKINGNIYIRRRNDGDRIKTCGMNKKLKELFRVGGVPCRQRDRIPLFCDDDGIIWIPGVAKRDGLLPVGSGETVYFLYFDTEAYLK